MGKGPIWRKLWPGGLGAGEETDGQGGSMSSTLGGDKGFWSLASKSPP